MCDSSQYVNNTHILIRSMDRTDFWGQTTSNFKLTLSKPQKGSKCQLSYCQLTNTYYNIKNSNKYLVVNGNNYSLDVGTYTLNSLMAALQNLLVDEGAFTITFSTLTNLITIDGGHVFTMNLNIPNSIAKVIGFNPYATYAGRSSYTGTNLPKIYDNAVYINVNFANNIQTSSQLKNVSFVIPNNKNIGEVVEFYSNTQFSLQPRVQNQTIGDVQIQVFDEEGELLVGLGEWCMMIQIL